MRYLVTGGAGYIGSHIVLALLDAGHEVAIIDNLSTGHREAVPSAARLHEVDLRDGAALAPIVGAHRWDGVFHLAALSIVGESMRDPLHYLEHNFTSSLNLIRSCTQHGVRKLVFSSTAALFGGPDRHGAITEDAAIIPGSAYGESKLFIERTLHWADQVHGLRSACLRYFNAAGADPDGRAGEDHKPETHLIPLALDAMLHRRPALQIFGTDYETPDGTCIRDYTHVSDIAAAHICVLDVLDQRSVAYNLGTGTGHSNLDVLKSIARVSGRDVPWHAAERRAGDPPMLVADATSFTRDTGWTPRYAAIDQIIETALAWRTRHPDGYGDAASQVDVASVMRR